MQKLQNPEKKYVLNALLGCDIISQNISKNGAAVSQKE